MTFISDTVAKTPMFVLERNDGYWGQHTKVERVRLTIVPDATTRALELRKGSADISPSGSLSADMIGTLRRDPRLVVEQQPGTVLAYMTFNLRDPILKDVRVRQALADGIDRETIIRDILRGQARPANSLLPPSQWAFEPDVTVYHYDPERAKQLLEFQGLFAAHQPLAASEAVPAKPQMASYLRGVEKTLVDMAGS